MSDRYPGGLIRKTPPTITPPVDGEGGSASGIWTMDQVAYYIKEDEWPKGVLPRELYAWGNAGDGVLGTGDTIFPSSPVQVGALAIWENIASEDDFTVATQTNGTLWSWGRSGAGQLGHNDRIARSSPVQVGALTNWYNVTAGTAFALATKTDGTLWSWGSNTNGKLGLGDTVNRSSPVQVGALTTWLDVVCGYGHSLANKTDGTLWAWGRNVEGQLGLGNTTNYSSPMQIGSLTTWLNISSGGYHCIVSKTDGTLWSWGENDEGQLGLSTGGAYTNESSPAQIGSLTNWSLPAAGKKTGVVVKTDGTLWVWGENDVGQLGLNYTSSYRNSPLQVGSLSTWAKVGASEQHTLATQTDGTLWSWGAGGNGRLGHDNTTSLSSPVKVGTETNWNKLPKMPLSLSSFAITRG